MKVLDPGHSYELFTVDPTGGLDQRLNFIKREGHGYPGNVGTRDGTNLQDCWRAEIDRIKYLDSQIRHPNNIVVVHNLEENIWLLEQRAAERHGRSLKVSRYGIDQVPFCQVCGHIGCIEHA